MTRRDLFKTAALAASAGSAACTHSMPAALHDGAFELSELTVDELGFGLRSGRWSVSGLVERYLERIEALDRRGPHLCAVIELNPNARAIAASLDPTNPRSCILGFLTLLSALANVCIRSSALYRSKISRIFKTLQI